MNRNPLSRKRCASCEVHKTASAFLPSRYTADNLTDRFRQCVLDASARLREEREALRVILRTTSIDVGAGD